jgi:Na+/proline symporter
MRYLAQFLVPALIILVVVYLLARTKRGQDESTENTGAGSDTGTFVLILVIGATVAVGSFFVLQAALG